MRYKYVLYSAYWAQKFEKIYKIYCYIHSENKFPKITITTQK